MMLSLKSPGGLGQFNWASKVLKFQCESSAIIDIIGPPSLGLWCLMPSLAPGDLDTIVAEDLSYDYTPSQKFGSSEVFRIPGIMSEIYRHRPLVRRPWMGEGLEVSVSFRPCLYLLLVKHICDLVDCLLFWYRVGKKSLICMIIPS